MWAAPIPHPNSSPSSSEEEVTEVKEGNPKKQSNLSETDWRAGVESTISGLGDSIRLMSESLQSLVKAGDKKKRKVKTVVKKPKKTKATTANKGGEPDLVPLTAQVNTFNQIHALAQDQGLSFREYVSVGRPVC